MPGRSVGSRVDLAAAGLGSSSRVFGLHGTRTAENQGSPGPQECPGRARTASAPSVLLQGGLRLRAVSSW